MDFWDKNKRNVYIKLQEMMRRAQSDPSLIETARIYVQENMLSEESHQRKYGEMWMEILDLPVEQIAQRLLADTPEGDLLRDTAPVFGKGLTSREFMKLLNDNA